jgi:hypothetical protein
VKLTTKLNTYLILGDSLDSIEKQLYTFLWETRYVILFYFFGDVISTLYALRLGYKEGNRIIVMILRHFGPVGFTIAKLLPVCCLFYYFTRTQIDVQTWGTAITLATVLGFFATVNNLSVVMKLNEKKETTYMLKSGLRWIETLISK